MIIFTGDIGKKRRKENLDKINTSIHYKKAYCVLLTGSLIGEGFDLPELDTFFLMMPISCKGRIVQHAGRLHREHKDKKEIHIYDYVDISFGLTISMFKKRIVGYRKMNYHIIYEPGSKLRKWI